MITTQKEFPVMRGVRQGCVISPHLFNIYREHIMWIVLTDIDGGVSITSQCINEIRYTDDTMLIAQSMEEMSLIFQCLKSTSKLYRLCLNIKKKTKVMVIGNVDDDAKQLTMENNVVGSVNIFIYLGAQIHTNGESSTDIRRRIMIAKKCE